MSDTTLAQDYQALAMSAAKLRLRTASEVADKASAARDCSTLEEVAKWAEDVSERRR